MKIIFVLIALILIINHVTFAQEYSYSVNRVELNHKFETGRSYTGLRQDSSGYIWLCSDYGIYVFDGYETIRYSNQDKQFPLVPDTTNIGIFDISLDTDDNLYFYPYHRQELVKFNTSNRSLDTTMILTDGSRFLSRIQFNKAKQFLAVRKFDDLSAYALSKIVDGKIIDLYHWKDARPEGDLYYDFAVVGEKMFLLTRHSFYQMDLDGNIEFKIENNTEDFSHEKIYRSLTEIYLKNIKGTEVSQWNTDTHTKSRFWNVPSDIGLDLELYIDSKNIIASSRSKLYVHDRATNKTRNLSQQYYNVKKAETPAALVDKILYIIPTEDGTYLLATATEVFKISRPIIDAAEFAESIQGVSEDISTREIIRNSNGDILLEYYSGIAKKKSGENQFVPLKIKYKNDDEMENAFSLGQWNDLLIWNNMIIDQDLHAEPISSSIGYNHTENIIVGDDLYFQLWFRPDFYHYNLQTKVLDTIRFYKMSNNEDSIERESVEIITVTKIIEDQLSNDFWMAFDSRGLGLVSKDGEIKKHYLINEMFGSEITSVFDMIQEDSILWLGTTEGLVKLNFLSNDHKLFPVEYADQYGKIKTRVIYSMLQGSDHSLLMGADQGLIHFDKRSGEFKELKQEHHLSNIEFNRNSILKDGDRYYFGSTVGLFSFTENELEWQEYRNEAQQELKVYSLMYQNDSERKFISDTRTLSEKISLEPNDRNIEIRFSYPNLEQNVFFSYQIPSIDTTWSGYARDNTIKLYSLPPGKHDIHIKASSSLVENYISALTMSIHQDQQWYKKWWAFLAYFALIVITFYLIYRSRIIRFNRYQLLRTKISSDLHDDVGTILSSVAMQSEVLGLSAPKEKIKQFEKLSMMSREAMGRMRDTVWAIDSRKDNVDSLVDRMKDYIDDINVDGQLKVNFETNIAKLSSKLPPDVRQNVYLIFKEAMNNALKYSDGNKINIHFSQVAKSIRLQIKDNGNVDAANIKTSGLGISNMKMRAERIKGTLTIDTALGFSVTLQVN